MKQIDFTYQTLYSELAQRTLDAAFTSEFSLDGRFVAVEVKGRKYWYYDSAKLPGSTVPKKRSYVGPADDPEITERVENFQHLKADYRARRKIVSTLVREAYLPRPEGPSGDIIEALATAGFFRLRGVLVGTVAFHCYGALLGVRLAGTLMQTADADFAQFHSIAVAVGDSMPPILEVLRRVDPTFREVPHQADGRYTTQFVAKSAYKVEFLTPNRGSEDHSGKPASMPSLGAASAQPLRFLNFLIHRPVRAVLLHNAGVPVLVPAPERYAVHKLIVASRRLRDQTGLGKGRKDEQQAEALMLAMIGQRQQEALADVYMEAWDRGPSWREALGGAIGRLPRAQEVVGALAPAIAKLGGSVADYGLDL